MHRLVERKCRFRLHDRRGIALLKKQNDKRARFRRRPHRLFALRHVRRWTTSPIGQ